MSTRSKDISCSSLTTPTSPAPSRVSTCTRTSSISWREPCRQVTQSRGCFSNRSGGSTRTGSGFAISLSTRTDGRHPLASTERRGRVRVGLTPPARPSINRVRSADRAAFFLVFPYEEGEHAIQIGSWPCGDLCDCRRFTGGGAPFPRQLRRHVHGYRGRGQGSALARPAF